MKVRLTSAFFDVDCAGSVDELDARIADFCPDLVIIDAAFGPGRGFAVCRRLKQDSRLAELPVMMAGVAGGADCLAASAAGAEDFVSWDVTERALLARVRGLVRSKHLHDDWSFRGEAARELGLQEPAAPFLAAQPARPDILIAAAGRMDGNRWASAFNSMADCQARIVTGEDDVLRDVAINPADAIIVEGRRTGGGHPHRLIGRLRSLPEARHAAIVMAADSEADGAAALGSEVGASDFVAMPVSIDELIARTFIQIRRNRVADGLRNRMREGLKLAITDPLTGLFNRRYALAHLAQFAERSRLTGQPFAVMMLDLDRFKRINDRFGHPAGDLILSEFAARLRALVRETDLVARMGGEEFLVAMPDTGESQARAIAERIRADVSGRSFRTGPRGVLHPVTVSIGVSVSSASGEMMPVGMMAQADAALYASKAAGRNCVRFSMRPAA